MVILGIIYPLKCLTKQFNPFRQVFVIVQCLLYHSLFQELSTASPPSCTVTRAVGVWRDRRGRRELANMATAHALWCPDESDKKQSGEKRLREQQGRGRQPTKNSFSRPRSCSGKNQTTEMVGQNDSYRIFPFLYPFATQLDKIIYACSLSWF